MTEINRRSTNRILKALLDACNRNDRDQSSLPGMWVCSGVIARLNSNVTIDSSRLTIPVGSAAGCAYLAQPCRCRSVPPSPVQPRAISRSPQHSPIVGTVLTRLSIDQTGNTSMSREKKYKLKHFIIYNSVKNIRLPPRCLKTWVATDSITRARSSIVRERSRPECQSAGERHRANAYPCNRACRKIQ
jgi:hypothetical protein